MVNLIYSDEDARLTTEISDLFEIAANEAVKLEYKEDLEKSGLSPEDINAEVSVTIVDDEEIRELNRDYRGNDKVTDVLSFPQFETHDDIFSDLSEDEEGAVTLLGDVVICYDQALRQAEEYGTGVKRELTYLFVHSICHLFGYDHEDEEERRVMRSMEERILEQV